MIPEAVAVEVPSADRVTALLYRAAEPAGITLILGHGAGAGQNSSFMVMAANELARRGIDAITFNFLYTEHRRRMPDRNDRLEACYGAVIETFADKVIHRTHGRNALAIGGKSMGGRIASQVAAKTPLDLAGLVYFGYPLHPPGKPDQLRAQHLPAIRAPMLFVQGSHDAFGTPDELRPILAKLGPSAELFVIEGGDHSFKVPKKAGIPQQDVYKAILDRVAEWLVTRRPGA
jgi:predicted alpha/beta-hydrolase family hydrolase